MNGNKSLYNSWMIILGLLLIPGIYAAIKVLNEGHGLFNANDVIIWSLPLGLYIFLALTSSGLALLASLPLVFGVSKYEPYAKRLVFLSLATLIGAFVSIGLELGNVFHMIYLLFSPNLSSPIWWMGTIYSVELLLLLIKFKKMHSGDDDGSLSRVLGIGSFLCALIAPLMIGSVFGLTESRVSFFGPFMSVYCLLLGMLSGTALFIFYNQILTRVGYTEASAEKSEIIDDIATIMSWMLGVVVVITLLKTALDSTTTIPDFMNYQKFAHAFGAIGIFHIEIILGLFLPFIIMIMPSTRNSDTGRLTAAALTLLGTLAMHMEILLAGQSKPVGPKAEQFPALLSYCPSIWEWLIALLAITIILILYTFGEKFFGLETGQTD